MYMVPLSTKTLNTVMHNAQFNNYQSDEEIQALANAALQSALTPSNDILPVPLIENRPTAYHVTWGTGKCESPKVLFELANKRQSLRDEDHRILESGENVVFSPDVEALICARSEV